MPKDVTLDNFRRVRIATIRAHPRNARRGHRKTISESIDEHGVYKAIIVQRSTGFVIAGAQTHELAMEKGRKFVIACYLDVDDDEAERIRVVDNRANDLATYDEALQAEVLRDLAASHRGLAGVGYGDAQVVTFLANVNAKQEAAALDTPARPLARGQVSRSGDVWQLGDHTLTCGQEGLEAADAMCEAYQRTTDQAPILERTGKRRNFL